MRHWGATKISLDSSQGYQLPTKTHSGRISWYQPDLAAHTQAHTLATVIEAAPLKGTA